MNKYLTLFNELRAEYGIEDEDVKAQEIEKFLSAQGGEVNKPLLTEAGLNILMFLQQNSQERVLRAAEIAEGMDLPSRKISGAMRKLVSDQFVEKFGSNPVVYSLTEKGKNFDINNYKGENNA